MIRQGTRLHSRAGNKTVSALDDAAANQGFSLSPQAAGRSEDGEGRIRSCEHAHWWR
jgi:hypothetical protein